MNSPLCVCVCVWGGGPEGSVSVSTQTEEFYWRQEDDTRLGLGPRPTQFVAEVITIRQVFTYL